MTGSEVIRSAFIKSGKTQRELADYMGWSRQNMNIRLRKDSLSFSEVEKALEFLGHRVVVQNDNGDVLLHYGNSAAPRLTCNVNGLVYDTSRSSLIASKKGDSPEGIDERIELYVDTAGREFVVYRFADGRGAITVAPAVIKRMKSERNDCTSICT